MSLAKKNLAGDVLSKYKSNEITTASQGQLIVMMYDGAIRFIQSAVDNMTPQKYDFVNNNIIKAQDIITELLLSLDMQKGDKIADNLFAIYVFLKKRLIEANLQKSTDILNEVKKHLKELRDAWVQAVKSTEVQNTPLPAGNRKSSLNIKG